MLVGSGEVVSVSRKWEVVSVSRKWGDGVYW